jgi:hypothetical protein
MFIRESFMSITNRTKDQNCNDFFYQDWILLKYYQYCFRIFLLKLNFYIIGCVQKIGFRLNYIKLLPKHDHCLKKLRLRMKNIFFSVVCVYLVLELD